MPDLEAELMEYARANDGVVSLRFWTFRGGAFGTEEREAIRALVEAGHLAPDPGQDASWYVAGATPLSERGSRPGRSGLTVGTDRWPSSSGGFAGEGEFYPPGHVPAYDW